MESLHVTLGFIGASIDSFLVRPYTLNQDFPDDIQRRSIPKHNLPRASLIQISLVVIFAQWPFMAMKPAIQA